MAHIKRETHQQSNIQRSDITKFVPALRTLQKIVLSCRSPSGQIKVIQNSCGGGLTLTSLCERLLKSLSVKKPVIQLLVTSTQGHLELFADGGLFVLSFASTLVLNSVDSGINSRLLAEIFESFLTLTTEICNSSDCSFIIDARVSDLNFMTSFIKSVLKPKLFCQLDDHLLSFISKLLLEVFLYSVSEKTDWSLQEYIYVLKIEGNDIEDSKSFPGVLIEAPELSRFKKCKLNTTKHVSSHGQCIKCVVVTASMSGDFDELGELKYDVENAVDKDEECLKQLTQFCEVLIVNKVGVLLCQKVVHPRLKLQLRGSGVVVVDRIGSGPIKYLTKLIGANAIQSIEMVIPMTSYGSLANLDHVIIQGRSYLHLTHPLTPVTSLILCHQEEQQLLELKGACEAGLRSLEKLLYHPHVFPGAGCWQAVLASHIHTRINKDLLNLTAELECSSYMIRKAANIFISSLLIASIPNLSHFAVNPQTGHIHKNPEDFVGSDDMSKVNKLCQCGLTEFSEQNVPIPLSTFWKSEGIYNNSASKGSYCGQPCSKGDNGGLEDNAISARMNKVLKSVLEERTVVLDGTAMCLGAVQTGVLSACSLLKIGQVMENF